MKCHNRPSAVDRGVIQKTVKLIFVVSPLSTQYKGEIDSVLV